ncbi:hypothetical protein SAMN05216555_10982 [Arthrobacter cupressi]|uniref:Lipoprotein n=2 Tax=Arthrobacter cupressi TaxID=1045773 RepID=A0A1G8SP08_9MICC|nr:hypothetical protein SAMN05216555_10982 [Arthrobacter cupressi]
MGGKMKIRSRLLLAAVLASTMALGACSFPVPTVQATQGSASPSSSSPEAEPSPDDTSTNGTGGLAGGFGSLNEACISVSATYWSISLLPMAGAMGGNPEDLKKLEDELAQLQGKVPDELKPHFEKLKAFMDSAGSDYSKHGTGEFEELSKPIQDWLDKNCK